MKVVIIQSSPFWEDPERNRNYFSEKINSISEQIDLIVLPEMFTTGFTMDPKNFCETMEGKSIAWMKALAKKKDAAITGSLVISENENFYNRLVFVFPTGKIEKYDKRHLFTLSAENEEYSAGKEKVIIEYRNWKICLQICYDLRFPVFSRNTTNYDLLIYVANWPKSRIDAWNILLKARAVENMSPVVAVNRIGIDGNGVEYNGQSQILNANGENISQPTELESIIIASIDKETTDKMRKKFPFLDDRDHFTVIQ